MTAFVGFVPGLGGPELLVLAMICGLPILVGAAVILAVVFIRKRRNESR